MNQCSDRLVQMGRTGKEAKPLCGAGFPWEESNRRGGPRLLNGALSQDAMQSRPKIPQPISHQDTAIPRSTRSSTSGSRRDHGQPQVSNHDARVDRSRQHGLLPVSSGHGETAWLGLSLTAALASPLCKNHAHCPDTPQNWGPQTQTVTASIRGSTTGGSLMKRTAGFY